MKNVTVELVGTTLVLRIDLTKTFGPSSTGKTIIVASSEGNQTVPDPAYANIRFGVNVYKK